MKIVIIDNYDSFTYNLAHLVKELGADVTVYRNDQFQLRELDRFDKIILSPGPGIPSEAVLVPNSPICRRFIMVWQHLAPSLATTLSLPVWRSV